MNLASLRIGTRLGAAFAIVLLLHVGVGVVGVLSMGHLNRNTEQIVKIEWPKVKLAVDALDHTRGSMERVFQATQTRDKETIKAATERFNANAKAFSESLEKLAPLLTRPAAMENLAKAQEARAKYVASAGRVLKLVEEGKREDASRLAMSETYELLHAYARELGKLTDFLEKVVDEVGADSAKAYGTTRAQMFALIGIAVVLAALLDWLITRSITRPLSQAVAAADAVGSGNLDVKLQTEGKDEVSQLLAAMSKMVNALKSFIAEQDKMATRHNEGYISHKIPVEQFAGVYAEAADKTNKLVQSHIDLMMKLTQVAGRYAKGDLSMDMDRLPQEKAALTEAMDTVKQSLTSVNAEISKLVDAAKAGDFTARGDEAHYEHDLRKMVGGLNQLMQVAQSGLSDVARVLASLAKGDLTTKIQADYQGMFGQLKDDANQTVDRLTEIVGQIKDATESINTAAKEIASGNTDLSQRTEEQASSLEETASSMEELTGTVRQNAENAKQANQLAAGASEIAVKGGAVVGQVVFTMSSISESSKKIVDIISVIDGIAFQTNILALNAAVEAARAGEQGRGFAVVATEVRNLAQRSAAAAKEIKELIGTSVEKVGAGTKLVDEAGKTMAEIVTSVKRVTDIMGEITAASQEQSGGIEQVNTAIGQMDEVTQQNAALVEEAAAAAESLEEQAHNLAQAVSVFKLAGAGPVSFAAVSRPVSDKVRVLPRKPLAAKGAARPAAAKPAAAPAKAAAGGNDQWEEF